MIQYESLFSVSYGLYIVCSGDRNRGNGFISNTVFQVTSEPPKFAACCNKNNYTAELIKKHRAFSFSVLEKNTAPVVFGTFGYKTGKDFDKFKGMNVRYGETGVPVVLDNSVAVFECKFTETYDVGSHLLFIGELVHAEMLDGSKEPLTYSYYRQVKKGTSPKNAPTYVDQSKLIKKPAAENFKKYKCPACGHIYDESVEKIRFKDLPDSWVCPVCGMEKADFVEVV